MIIARFIIFIYLFVRSQPFACNKQCTSINSHMLSAYAKRKLNIRNKRPVPSVPTFDDDSIESIEARLKAKWEKSMTRRTEFYDDDDEGYEENYEDIQDEKLIKVEYDGGESPIQSVTTNGFLFRRPNLDSSTQLTETNKIHLKPQTDLQPPALHRGLPLTMQAVAERYRSKMDTELSSPFPFNSFSTFKQLLEIGSQLLMPSSMNSIMLFNFSDSLLSNLEKELSHKLIDNDAKPVHSTSLDEPSLTYSRSSVDSKTKRRRNRMSGDKQDEENQDRYDQILRSVKSNLHPTKVQIEAMKEMVNGLEDVILCAPTGCGKTLGYILPLLLRGVLSYAQSAKGPKIIIVCPGRELAVQCAGIVYTQF